MYIIFQVTLIQEIYTLPSNFFQITIWTSLQVSTESQNLPFLYCLCTNIHIHTHIWFFHYIDHIHFNFCTHIFTLLSAQKSKIAKLWKQNKINKHYSPFMRSSSLRCTQVPHQHQIPSPKTPLLTAFTAAVAFSLSRSTPPPCIQVFVSLRTTLFPICWYRHCL